MTQLIVGKRLVEEGFHQSVLGTDADEAGVLQFVFVTLLGENSCPSLELKLVFAVFRSPRDSKYMISQPPWAFLKKKHSGIPMEESGPDSPEECPIKEHLPHFRGLQNLLDPEEF